MKKIEAIIKPFKLDEVKQALAQVGVIGLTVSEVLGAGRRGGRMDQYRGIAYRVDLIPKIKLEIAIPDGRTDQVISAISRASKIGPRGHGMIFVVPLEDAVRIRTGEHGEAVV